MERRSRRHGRSGATAGTTGTGGANSCAAGGRLDCTSAGSLELTPDGQIVDFSAAQWNNTTARFCDAHGLDGGLSSYAGTGSTAAAAVDTTAQNLKLNFMVTAGQYAGGRVNFDSCVDASGFNSIQFTASVTAGSLTGCAWQVQLQTQNERPTTLTNPMGGTCNATTTTCERYPAAALTAPTATAAPMTVRFTAFDNPSASTIMTPTQIRASVAGQLEQRHGRVHRRAAHRQRQIRHSVRNTSERLFAGIGTTSGARKPAARATRSTSARSRTPQRGSSARSRSSKR